MRRLLAAFALLVLPVLATAQPREALLTPEGTLFTIESQVDEIASGGRASAHLVLRAQQGSDITVDIVPATLQHGAHVDPAIAYDAETKTLFVFWLRHLGGLASQLMFACRDEHGTWSEAQSFGERFDYRENLRIAVTRKAQDEETETISSGISVHLAWWEFDTNKGGSSAQYALVTIENGAVQGTPQYLELASFVGGTTPAEENTEAAEPLTDEQRNVLKQPLLFAAPSQDSVLVVFGDFATSSMHQVRVFPKNIKAEGRLRVPVGRRESTVPGPKFSVAESTRVEGIHDGYKSIALFTRSAAKLDYVIMKDGAWSDSRVIALDEQVTGDAAVNALRRLLHDH
jgi:hypothetical protein